MVAAAYVGAGADVRRPLEYMPDLRTLVCLDPQPFTEFPGPRQVVGYRRPLMWGAVCRRLARLGFRRADPAGPVPPSDRDAPTRVEFAGPGGRRVVYWFNASVPFASATNASLAADLRACTRLVVAGHDPHSSILGALAAAPLELVAMHGTVYSPDPDEPEGTCSVLHSDERAIARIASVMYCTRRGCRRFRRLSEVVARALS